MDNEKVTQLDTVFGTLRPGRSYAQVRAQAGPFTSRNLLDETYGFFDRIPPTGELCPLCGETLYQRACYACGAAKNVASLEFDAHEVERQIVAHEGGEFEFFAHRWWKLDREGYREHVVKDRKRLGDLNRLGGRTKRRPEPLARLQSYDRPSKPADLGGAWDVRTVKVAGVELEVMARATEFVCTCSDETEHIAHNGKHSALGTVCKVHGSICGTCDEDHILLSGRKMAGIND